MFRNAQATFWGKAFNADIYGVTGDLYFFQGCLILNPLFLSVDYCLVLSRNFQPVAILTGCPVYGRCSPQ